VPAARGRGAGSTALRLLAEHLLATTEVDRIEAGADHENRPSQRALAKAGFRREGTLRGAQLRGGERRDMVTFGLLRDDLAGSDADGRVMIAEGDGFAIAEWTPRDEELLLEQNDGSFDVDPDERERLHGGAAASSHCALVDPAGALLGQISWHAVGYGPTAGCTAWNLGLMLLPSVRGRGIGAAATRRLAEHLFATTPVDRVEASTDRENLPAQRVLTKAGFHSEGTIRGAQFRGGARRDMIAFSLLRSDLPEPDDVERELVATADGIALGDLRAGEREWLAEVDDHAFESDPDPRPGRHHPQISRLAVLDRHTDELLGSVSWHAVGYGRGPGCEAWNIGIGLQPAARGRGAGAIALRLLSEYLFASTDLDRIEAGTDRDNVPCQRALAKAGFRTEGLLRGVHVRGGRRHDMLSYSLLRGDLGELPAPDSKRVTVLARDGVVLAEPVSGDREKFYVAGAGDFAIDPDDRPRVSGASRSSLLSVVDESTGELLGGVSWHAVDYGGTVSCSAWNIGIGLLPEARGRGVGSVAQRLLVEHLFATTELDRVEASTDVENVAERRALEKAGFRPEGVLRGAQLRGGVRRDLAQYGLVRGDF
jgi:RimJ/RimL family protein N-acetyltransferase